MASPSGQSACRPRRECNCLQACIGELLGNGCARRVLLHLVSPAACRRLLSPAQVAVLEPRLRLRAPAADRAPSRQGGRGCCGRRWCRCSPG